MHDKKSIGFRIVQRKAFVLASEYVSKLKVAANKADVITVLLPPGQSGLNVPLGLLGLGDPKVRLGNPPELGTARNFDRGLVCRYPGASVSCATQHSAVQN